MIPFNWIDDVELVKVLLHHKQTVHTGAGDHDIRPVVFVHLLGGDAEGWGECVALARPTYTEEYADGAMAVLEEILIPQLVDCWKVQGYLSAVQVRGCLEKIRGHSMSKMALEMAVLDAELRAVDLSLADRLGGVKKTVEVGAVLGIDENEGNLLSRVAELIEKGYKRVKIKIMPGFDVNPVRRIRETFPDLQLQVDANGSYDASLISELVELDNFELSLIEQPFANDDLLSHAELRKRISTPVCLDESICSENDVHLAIALGACDILCVKPGRVGGYLSAAAIHDICMGKGIPVWCGGMYETAVARSANVSLASLPGFSLPGDLEPPSDYLEVDIAEMLKVRCGEIDVPTSYGIPLWPDEDILMQVATERRRIPVKKRKL